MKNKHFLAVFMLLIGNYLYAQSDSVSWKFIKKQGDISVYRKEIKDNGNAEIKLVVLFNTSIDKVADYLLDISKYKYWVYNLMEMYTLKSISSNEQISYNCTYFPILDDRDIVIHSSWERNPKTHVLTIRSKALSEQESIAYKPIQKGRQRMSIFETTCVLEPQGNKTLFTYRAIAHPAGIIPTSIADKFLDYGPIKSMMQLQSQLHQ